MVLPENNYSEKNKIIAHNPMNSPKQSRRRGTGREGRTERNGQRKVPGADELFLNFLDDSEWLGFPIDLFDFVEVARDGFELWALVDT